MFVEFLGRAALVLFPGISINRECGSTAKCGYEARDRDLVPNSCSPNVFIINLRRTWDYLKKKVANNCYTTTS